MRKSLSLRLQPYEGTPLAVVADYLNSLDKEEATKKVGDILVMALLPYAKFDSGKANASERLRSIFLASRDLMEKHFGIMALTLELESSLLAPVTNQNISHGDGGNINTLPSMEESENEPVHTSLISGKATASEIANIF